MKIFNKVLQRSPKLIEEIKGYPIFCKECGTNLTIKISMISVVIFISTFAKTTMINTITTVIIIILIIRLFSTGKMNFFQYITAEEPTETEMEVALSGIIEWEKMEQEYKFSKSRI